jgi:hypothetical protein
MSISHDEVETMKLTIARKLTIGLVVVLSLVLVMGGEAALIS